MPKIKNSGLSGVVSILLACLVAGFGLTGCGQGRQNASAPQVNLKSQYDLNDYAQDIVASGNYVYVSTHSSGMVVFDATDESHVRKIGNYNQCQNAYSMATNGLYLYTVSSDSGIVIFDISNPANLLKVEFDSLLMRHGQIAINGTIAYILSRDGLLIYDIIDPASPILLDQTSLSNATGDLYLFNNYIYFEDAASMPNWPDLQIVDISNPQTPNFIGRHKVAGDIHGLSKVGDFLYFLRGGFGGCFLMTFDIGNPETPIVIDSINIGSIASGLIARNDLLYFCDNREGLRIFTTSDTTGPEQIGAYEFTYGASKIVNSGSNLYIITRHSLLICEVIP